MTLTRGRFDVHEAARVVRGDHRASSLGNRVQLPLRQAARDARPLDAEGASEPAAVRDVRDVDDLIAGELEKAPRLALETELAQALAGVVVGDLQAHAARVHEFLTAGQDVEHETRRVAHARAGALVRRGAPVRGVDRKGPEARSRRRHDQTLGISKALRQIGVQARAALEVARVGRDEAAAPLTLGKANLEAGSRGNPLQRHSGLRLYPVDHAGREDRERLALAVAGPKTAAIG